MSRARQAGFAVAAALIVLGSVARAVAAEPHRPFILDRGSIEVLLAQGAWRSGLSADEANPGFSVLGGGSELVLGLDVVPGIGIIVSGRVLATRRLEGVYLEGLASLGVQVRVTDWVRLRGGIAAGRVRLDRNGIPTDYATLVGGFLAASVDLFRFARDRAATELALRFDADGHLDPGTTFPRESVSLSLAAGIRF